MNVILRHYNGRQKKAKKKNPKKNAYVFQFQLDLII